MQFFNVSSSLCTTIANRQNGLETPLEEVGLFIGWIARGALQECLEHDVDLARLRLLDVALNPWADLVNALMNVMSRAQIAGKELTRHRSG